MKQNRCLARLLPLRMVLVVMSSTNQALPGQFSLMYSGASFARSSQAVQSEAPTSVTAMAFLVSHCGERDLARPLDLATDLAVELRLVRFDGQDDVGALVETPAKKTPRGV